MNKYFISGGAGFIGSHITKYLLSKNNQVHIYDNFSSGSLNHLKKFVNHPKITITKGDLKNLNFLRNSMKKSEIIIHCAANPDIAKAQFYPPIDFWEGTLLTQNILESMRLNNIKNLIYTSGSGVYGEKGKNIFDEDFEPKNPISTYGASKLACEALISSYCKMFSFNALNFRFANVVGLNQTHGVGYDFIKKLKNNSKTIKIFGNGLQKKSYIHINDVIKAIFFIKKKTKFTCKKKFFIVFNVASKDTITVNQILKLALKEMNIKHIKIIKDKKLKGWSGDVPIIKLNCNKIIKYGWTPSMSSEQAIELSLKELR